MICKKCGTNTDEYYGNDKECKPCRRARSALYRETYPEKSRRAQENSRLKKAYGITVDDRNQMLADQDGKCAICLRSPDRLVVDHCHRTGRVRGILCVNCNHRLLGAASDNPEILERAARYLRNYGTE